MQFVLLARARPVKHIPHLQTASRVSDRWLWCASCRLESARGPRNRRTGDISLLSNVARHSGNTRMHESNIRPLASAHDPAMTNAAGGAWFHLARDGEPLQRSRIPHARTNGAVVALGPINAPIDQTSPDTEQLNPTRDLRRPRHSCIHAASRQLSRVTLFTPLSRRAATDAAVICARSKPGRVRRSRSMPARIPGRLQE